MIYLNINKICLNSINKTFFQNIILTSNYRTFSSSASLLRKKSYKEEKYRLKDRINENFSIIYKAPLEYYVPIAKHFTSLSLLLFLGDVGFNLYRGSSMNTKLMEGLDTLTASENELYIFGIGFLVSVAAIQIFANRFPLRIYKDQEANYIAIFEGQIPMRTTSLSFKKGELMEQPQTGILPWKDSRYTVNNRKLILIMNNFKTPSELFEMLSPINKYKLH